MGNTIKQTIRSDCNKHIIKREHYTKKDGDWKPKKKFDTEESAQEWIKQYKMYRYSPYICKVCGKWHIGMKNIKIEYNEENQ